jgi:hypothetical protein
MVINKPEYHAWKADEVSNIDYGVSRTFSLKLCCFSNSISDVEVTTGN